MMNRNIYMNNQYQVIPTLALLLIILLSACGTVQIGRDFDITAFESTATVGETSKAQVIKLLGSPKSIGAMQEKSGERFDEWVYFFGTGRMPGMRDAGIKILQIRFDKDGLVRGYNWSDSQ